MTENLYLIDTDILSYILKRQKPAYQTSQEYIKRHEKFHISCITYYECLRGYKSIGAVTRLQVFYEFLKLTDILYLDQAILEKAGEIYSVLKQAGSLPGEFDILIGATVLNHNLILITNNERHYKPIQNHFPLKIFNWMDKKYKHDVF